MHSALAFDSDLAFEPKISPSWPSARAPPCLSEKMSLLRQTQDFPMPHWTRATRDSHGRCFPQSIAHRGFKAQHPENTLRAFKAAVHGRAHALETDVHLSRDGVVVLSHDKDLKRCFGIDKKIIDCDWSELSQIRTLREPHEPMPRLSDLLEYISRPENEHIWLLLDIKIDNDADDVMRLIAATIDSVTPSRGRSWKDRIVLGLWIAKFLPLATRYLPDFPVSHIGFSIIYARSFLKVPNVGFNMFAKILMGPIGSSFIRDVKAAGRELLVWTVNDEKTMKWSVQKGLDGVITDNPEKFRQICDEWRDDEEGVTPTAFQWLYAFWLYFVVWMFRIVLSYRFPETVEDFLRNNPRAREPRKISM